VYAIGADKCGETGGRGRRQQAAPGNTHRALVTQGGSQRSTNAAQFVRAEQLRRWHGGITGQQRWQLNQATAADDGIDESGKKSGAQYERAGKVRI